MALLREGCCPISASFLAGAEGQDSPDKRGISHLLERLRICNCFCSVANPCWVGDVGPPWADGCASLGHVRKGLSSTRVLEPVFRFDAQIPTFSFGS